MYCCRFFFFFRFHFFIGRRLWNRTLQCFIFVGHLWSKRSSDSCYVNPMGDFFCIRKVIQKVNFAAKKSLWYLKTSVRIDFKVNTTEWEGLGNIQRVTKRYNLFFCHSLTLSYCHLHRLLLLPLLFTGEDCGDLLLTLYTVMVKLFIFSISFMICLETFRSFSPLFWIPPSCVFSKKISKVEPWKLSLTLFDS